MFAGICFIIFIELSQLLCTERHTDIDDVILNTSGVLIGACILFAIRKLKKTVDFSEMLIQEYNEVKSK